MAYTDLVLVGGFTLIAPMRKLLQQLNSEKKAERASAYEEILQMGLKARAVVRRAVESNNWYTREIAVRALGHIGGTDDLDVLKGLLADRSGKVKKAAVRAIVSVLLRTEPDGLDDVPIDMDDLVFEPLQGSNLSARDFLEENLDRREPEDWVVLGALYLEESLADEAYEALSHAYHLDPKVFENDSYYYLWEQVHYLAGLLYPDGERNSEIAGACLEVMLKLRPTDTMVMLNYGSYLGAVGRADEAYLMYRRALTVNPEDHFVIANMQALPLSLRERRELDHRFAGDNVLYMPPRPNLGSDGVLSYKGRFVQIQIPNPPFRYLPDVDDPQLSTVIGTFLNSQGLKAAEFDIYSVELVDVSHGAPTLFVDVVLKD